MQLLQEERARFGRQIRKARKDAGLSHDKLAARVGSSRQHLIKLEKGIHLPGPRLLEAIARETGKDVSFFENGDEDDEESDPVAALTLALRRVIRDELERNADTTADRAKLAIRTSKRLAQFSTDHEAGW